MIWTYNEKDDLFDSDSASYEYDDNGNVIKKTVGADVVNYIYNVEYRLIRVEDGTGTVIAEYYYDPFGKRLWKDVGGTRTYFLYSDEGLIAEFDTSGQEIKSYGYSLSSPWTTNPLLMKEGDNYYFYQNDHLGTPQKMTAINGAVVWEARYTSFGEVTIEPSSTITNNLRFPGQYYDEETGLHYNYFRYYAPSIGRYLRVDSIGLAGGVNLFAYVLNKPNNLIDPFGLCVDPCCENCIIKHVENNSRPTGRTRTNIEWDELEILRWRFYQLCHFIIIGSGGVTIGESKTFVIGTRYFQQEYAYFDCWIEICLDTMMISYEACNKKSGTEYWVDFGSEDIKRTVVPDIPLDDFPWQPQLNEPVKDLHLQKCQFNEWKGLLVW